MSGLETLGSWHTRGWQCALPHHKTCSLRKSRHPAGLPQISIWLSMYVMLWNKSDPWKHRHPVCCEVGPPCVGLVPGCRTNAQSGWTLGKLEASSTPWAAVHSAAIGECAARVGMLCDIIWVCVKWHLRECQDKMISVFHFHPSVMSWLMAVRFIHLLHSDPHFLGSGLCKITCHWMAVVASKYTYWKVRCK